MFLRVELRASPPIRWGIGMYPIRWTVSVRRVMALYLAAFADRDVVLAVAVQTSQTQWNGRNHHAVCPIVRTRPA